MENLNLQYMLSNGNYTNVDAARIEEFIDCAVARSQKTKNGRVVMTRDEIITALQAGRELSTGTDWYAMIRSLSAYEAIQAKRSAARTPITMVKCDCGHTIPAGSVMSASLGSSCPNCYDRLSN